MSQYHNSKEKNKRVFLSFIKCTPSEDLIFFEQHGYSTDIIIFILQKHRRIKIFHCMSSVYWKGYREENWLFGQQCIIVERPDWHICIHSFIHSFSHSVIHSFGNVTVTAQAIFFNTAVCWFPLFLCLLISVLAYPDADYPDADPYWK